jgi:dienelactone hydrolase
MRNFRPSWQELESRTSLSLVFVFSGAALAAAKPDAKQTGLAAQQLDIHGDRAIQLATPAMSSPGDFYQVADEIRVLSKGQPIGLMGFSAGGALAMRLSSIPSLNVQAVMNYYGPPDLQEWLDYHRGDVDYNYVTSHVQLTPGIINLFSGPSASTAFIVNAFGLEDTNVVASQSAASFERDFHDGQVFYYPGRHEVTLFADYHAFKDFLSHLPP